MTGVMDNQTIVAPPKASTSPVTQAHKDQFERDGYFILEGIEEFTGVTIISNRSKQISDMIQNQLGRGLTIYSGKKGFGKRGENLYNTDIIFTVITRLEINRLTTEVERIDPHAFIVMQSIKDTRGGMVKKMPLKE